MQIAAHAALGSVCRPVIAVTGANAEQVTNELTGAGVEVAENKDWEMGMSLSIKKGINYLQKVMPEVESVIIMLCDQPFADANLLNSLIEKKISSGKNLVACSYNNTVGVPALFDRQLFSSLLLLQGQEGAKKIIINHLDEVVTVPFDLGSVDIDTADDYALLVK